MHSSASYSTTVLHRNALVRNFLVMCFQRTGTEQHHSHEAVLPMDNASSVFTFIEVARFLAEVS